MHVEKRCKKKKEETINYENNEDCRINREKKKVFLESILSILIVENRKFIRSSMLNSFTRLFISWQEFDAVIRTIDNRLQKS